MLASNLLMLCFFLQSAHAATSPAASSYGNPSFLELNAGLNLSVSTSFNVAIAAYGAYFSPILSSSGFNSTNSSKSLGFSVGFLFSRSSSGYVNGNIYLAVCGGLSGNYTKFSEIIGMWGHDDAGKDEIFPSLVADGYVVPVWIANPDNPLSSVKSSLVVVAVSDHVGGATRISNELQLRDHNGRVVWRVSSNATSSMMEMQDTGNLVIYDSMSTTNVVWQSSTQPRDTLLQGQMLTVGKELTSNDSSYSVRMQKGGLVFYDNLAQFIEQPSPYWAIPILYDTRATNLLNLNSLVFSPPCSNPDDAAYGRLGNSSLMFFLEPGPCSNNMSGMANYLYNFYDNNTIPAWSFVKLEGDGRLYAYAVNSGTIPPSIQVRVELYTLASYATGQAHFAGALDPMPYSWWGECDVPMACGPLGVCSSRGADTLCACPDGVNFFKPTGGIKGCTRSTSLPPCSSGNEHINTTDYLQLNHTASIFLFGGWAYNSTSAPVEICKKTCSSNCSCTGFFYQSNTSACFFITKEITLLNVADTNLTYRDSSSGDERVQKIFARNYVTYLKVTSAAESNSTAPRSKHATIAIAVWASFVACLVLGLAVYLFSARKCEQASQAGGDQEAEELELRDILPGVLPTRFSYQDLHKATGAFSKLLGAGGCGSVYSGVLPDGRKIAVKFLEFGLLKGHAKQFLAEVSTMGRTSHHNIVRLVGFCWELSNRLLVYEYVERGSLDHWLFVKEGAAAEAAPLLDWKTRYNVALGMARGLSYLHEDCPQPILHFDIKPQNILLDGAFVAKLADFGMSRLMQRDVSEVVTGVRGTPGYIAPEWVSHGAVGKKSDVYSMGMVMLEIVGGRRNVDVTLRVDSALYPAEEWYFPSWAAKKCNQGLMMELVDKRLLQTFDEEQAQRLIHTAFWCIHENPSMRPYAPTVVQWLEGDSPVKEPPFSIANAMSYSPLDSCEKSHCSSFTLDAMSTLPPLLYSA